ncbi:hypothetical protein IE4803_CH03010 [Rhizobium etli bv. phaseoli str. IE4803]|nr:hypothetical protein IE4803_CH03010 [Rhizobium etli bv. phaseoli str. IE4803]
MNHQGSSIPDIERNEKSVTRIVNNRHARHLSEKVGFSKVGNQALIAARTLRAE